MLKLKRKPALKLVPKIDKEFAGLIAPLTAEEYSQLEANLIAHGCLDALVVWRGLLLDGHNRLEICHRHGIPYDTTEIDLPDREAARLWIEENQLGRRNLTTDQRAAVAYRIMQRRVAISKKQRAAKAGASHGSAKMGYLLHSGSPNILWSAAARSLGPFVARTPPFASEASGSHQRCRWPILRASWRRAAIGLCGPATRL
jgi:hypothetical protein